jgi:hypothetical protein
MDTTHISGRARDASNGKTGQVTTSFLIGITTVESTTSGFAPEVKQYFGRPFPTVPLVVPVQKEAQMHLGTVGGTAKAPRTVFLVLFFGPLTHSSF